MNATLEAMMANFNSYKTGKTMKEAKTQRSKAQVDRMDLVLKMAQIENRITEIEAPFPLHCL